MSIIEQKFIEALPEGMGELLVEGTGGKSVADWVGNVLRELGVEQRTDISRLESKVGVVDLTLGDRMVWEEAREKPLTVVICQTLMGKIQTERYRLNQSPGGELEVVARGERFPPDDRVEAMSQRQNQNSGDDRPVSIEGILVMANYI